MLAKSKLDKFLGSMTEKDFHMVRMRINIGESLRNLEKTYKVSIIRMAVKLKITVYQYHLWRNGAINFDIRMIAQIECLSTDLFGENNDIVITMMDATKKK